MKVTYFVKEERDMKLVRTLKNGVTLWRQEEWTLAIAQDILVGEFDTVPPYEVRAYEDRSTGTVFELDPNREWSFNWNKWISALSKLEANKYKIEL